MFRKLIRFIKRTLHEISLDFKSGNFSKIGHLIKCLFKSALFGYPKDVTVEPINTCNLRCEFCSSPPALIEREIKAMSLEEFKKIINDLAPIVHYLWLFLVGEPFLNKDFCQMIKYARSKNMHTITSTNMMPLDKETIGELVNSGLDKLIVSLDGASKETFEAMRLGASFEKVLANLKFLIKEKKRQKKIKPEIELQFLVSKINEHEIDDFVKLTKSLGEVKYEFKTLAIPTWIYDQKKCQEIAEKYLPKKGKTRYKEGKLKQAGPCGWAKRSIILVDGTVCMCCYDIKGKYCFGNVFEKKFLDIWNSQKYKKTRELMRKRALPLCKVCGESYQLY